MAEITWLDFVLEHKRKIKYTETPYVICAVRDKLNYVSPYLQSFKTPLSYFFAVQVGHEPRVAQENRGGFQER